MRLLARSAGSLLPYAVPVAVLVAIVGTVNWFNGGDPEAQADRALGASLRRGPPLAIVEKCARAHRSPNDSGSLFDCTIRARYRFFEVKLADGSRHRLGGRFSVCFSIPSATRPRSLLPPERARAVKLGACLAA